MLSRRTFFKLVSLTTVPLSPLGDLLAQGPTPEAPGPLKASPLSEWREPPFLDPDQWITPADHFFVRHHLKVPQVEIGTWKLVVEGLVEQRLEISYADLLSLPRNTEVVTLECAGNLPGGGMAGNAQWTGVRLASVLGKAGIKPGALEVIFDGADFGLDEGELIPVSYSRSIPVQKALASETLLATEMNGMALSVDRGFPLRAVVPGWYAMAHVKWLHRIEITDRPYAGFYMAKRYFTAKREPLTGEFIISPVREMGVKSQIARPKNGEALNPQPYAIQGAAWTGNGRVEGVEVSVDGGKTWQKATLGRERAPYAWVLWEYLWQSPEVGGHTLLARAFDSRGETQPTAEDPERINRYANRWIHRVKVTVVGLGSRGQ